MEGRRSSKRVQAQQHAANCWPSLHEELWIYILSMVSLFDRLANVAGVCRLWRHAVFDLLLSQEKFDVSEWSTELSHLSLARERAMLNRAFYRGINISVGCLKALDFGPNFQLKAKHLLYAASRCPNLQELVLPGLYRNSTEEGLAKIFRKWSHLESLTLGEDHDRYDIFGIIGKSCPSLKVLDVRCYTLSLPNAMDILSHMPRLKVLKVQCRFGNYNLEFSTYKLMLEMPELEEISMAVDNQPTRYHTRVSNSQPWDIDLEGFDPEIPEHAMI